MPGQADVVKSVLVKIGVQSGQQVAQPFRDMAKHAGDADKRVNDLAKKSSRLGQDIGQNFNKAREGLTSLNSGLAQLGRGIKPVEDLIGKMAVLAQTLALIKGVGGLSVGIAGGIGNAVAAATRAAGGGGPSAGTFAEAVAADTIGSVIGNRLDRDVVINGGAGRRTGPRFTGRRGLADVHHVLPGGVSPARVGTSGGLAGPGGNIARTVPWTAAQGGLVVAIAASGIVLADAFINKLRGEKSTLQKIFEGFGFGEEGQRTERLQARSDRLRGGLGEALAATRDEAESMRAFRGRTAGVRAGFQAGGDALIMRAARTAPFAFQSPAEQTALQAAREQAGDLAKTSADKLVAANQAVEMAQRSAVRASQEQLRVAEEIAAKKFEGAEAESRIEAATKRRMDAERAVLDAMKQQSATQIDVMQQWANLAKQQRNHWQGIVDAQKQSRETFAEQFGLMSRPDRNRIGRIADRFAANPANVRPEDLQELGRFGVFKDQVSAEARRRAEADPLFRRLAQQSGVDQRISQAEKARDLFAKVAVDIEQRIEIKMATDTEAFASQIIRQVTPQYHALIHQTVEALRDAIRREQLAIQANRML